VNQPPYDLRAAGKRFAAAWQQFFFAPVDPRVCALLRIGYALFVLINLAAWYPDLERWFTNSGVLPRGDVGFLQARERWSLLNWLPDGLPAVQFAFAVFALQATLLLLGAASRFNALCVLVWLFSFQHRNPLPCDSQDTLLRLIGAYLLLMPIGRAWSLDEWWRRSRGISSGLWPAPGLRLLQIQMCVIFLTAAWCKLDSDAWRSGIAMFYVMQIDDYFGRVALPTWLIENAWAMRLLTWTVIAIEFVVPFGVWFRQTRRPALLLALALHVGIELTMHLFLFHWIMTLGWCAFLLPPRSGGVPPPPA
jgi:hypothetical protein